MQFDDVLKTVGEFGPYQICLYILLGLVGIPTGYHNMGITFYGADMDHWCRIPRLANFSHDQQKKIAIPSDEDDKQMYSRCMKFNFNFDSLSDEDLLKLNRSLLEGTTSRCDSGWVFDQSEFVSTVVNKMELVCDQSHLVSIIQTIYMLGFLIGCVVFGQISDRFGRKPALMTSLVLEVAFAIAATFTPNYAGYVVLRFVVGMSAAGSFTTIFVISMEIIGRSWRMATGIMVQAWFALGFMILPGMSYAIRDHIKLQIITSVVPVILLLFFFLVPESPRWLVMKGRDEEAICILRKMADINGKQFPENLSLEDNRPAEKDPSARKPSALDLLKTPTLRKITLNMCFAWLVTSMVYYGLSLGVSLLGGSIFLNSFISGVIELPSDLLVAIFLDKTGRRWPTVITLVVSGVSCLLCMAFVGRDDLRVALTVFLMVGKFFITATFAIIYVYAAELFPTVIRQVGVGSASMCARVGGLIQPQLARLESSWGPAPFLVYGATSVVAGALAVLFPETAGKKLPETIDEGEQFGKKMKVIPLELSEENGKTNPGFEADDKKRFD